MPWYAKTFLRIPWLIVVAFMVVIGIYVSWWLVLVVAVLNALVALVVLDYAKRKKAHRVQG